MGLFLEMVYFCFSRLGKNGFSFAWGNKRRDDECSVQGTRWQRREGRSVCRFSRGQRLGGAQVVEQPGLRLRTVRARCEVATQLEVPSEFTHRHVPLCVFRVRQRLQPHAAIQNARQRPQGRVVEELRLRTLREKLPARSQLETTHENVQHSWRRKRTLSLWSVRQILSAEKEFTGPCGTSASEQVLAPVWQLRGNDHLAAVALATWSWTVRGGTSASRGDRHRQPSSVWRGQGQVSHMWKGVHPQRFPARTHWKCPRKDVQVPVRKVQQNVQN